MSWFKSRRQPPTSDASQGSKQSPSRALPGLGSGVHRSPGLALLAAELDRRPPRAILDLGSSSTENVSFLSKYCDKIALHGLYQVGAEAEAARSTLFRFDETVVSSLPEDPGTFDVVLLWDLLHYFEPARLGPFVARLADLSRPGAWLFLLASATAPVPLAPIRFKIRQRERLEYAISGRERAPAPHLWTREVERILRPFTPYRSFQLRNGYQEFLFRLEADTVLEPPESGPSLKRP